MRIGLILLAILLSGIASIMLTESSSVLDYYALQNVQRASGNHSPNLEGMDYVDIMNATQDMRPKISPGAYDSTKYDIPVGPYTVSFELRTPQKVFGVSYFTWNETAGSGKTYHTNYYEQYPLYVSDGARHRFWMYITHYMGPANYPPAEPGKYLAPTVPKSWDTTDPIEITIDGHPGYTYLAHGKTRGEEEFYYYNLNSSTFIGIMSNMDSDKDLALAIETLHITENR